MKKTATHIAKLILKETTGKLTPEELSLLEQWRALSVANQEKYESLRNFRTLHDKLNAYTETEYQAAGMQVPDVSALERETSGSKIECKAVRIVDRRHFLNTSWFRYAGVILLIAAASVVIAVLTNHNTPDQTLVSGTSHVQTEIEPGRERAILTLANGRQIVLDSTQGTLVKQDGLTVVNLAGKLKYDGEGTRIEYNTISTPKGGQYQIILPDGSKVWLNAASSITFPTTFTGNTRQVEMTGEAYMEIAGIPRQPFTVKARGAEIQVLGTSFNINAYTDERVIKTTLLEGSLKVTAGNQSNDNTGASPVILKPGQQAVSDPSDQQQKSQPGIEVINKVPVEKVMAWKNGVFNFDNMKLEEAMRQLEKWYDIEVVYEKGIPEIRFFGELSRDLSLQDLIEGLKASQVNFRIEKDRRLVVLP